MEMCPYCGEDVPGESKRCWKCGTELSGDGEGGDGPDSVQQRKKGSDGPQAECPYCQAIVPAKALRCNECGRQVRQVSTQRNWIPAVYSAFGVVLLATVVWLVYAFVAGGGEKEPPREHLKAKYPDLVRLYGKNTDKKLDLWDRNHAGKFVKWEMVILEADRESGTLKLGDEGDKPERPQVVLSLQQASDIETRKLLLGKRILYSAQLDRFEGKTFILTKGVVEGD